MVINKLKPIKDDFLSYVESQDGSISQLSLTVNDSATGRDFHDFYDMGDVLGEGGYAVVYRCKHRERGHEYAVKEIFNEEYETSGENLKQELDALKRLRDGPYVVRLLDVFRTPERTFMVMEELKGGDLLEKIVQKEVYNEQDARKLSRRLLEAIAFCHRKHIVHRDIKPENILLVNKTDDTYMKLADFGCARQITGPKCCRTLCGSPQYVAPEVYMHEDGYDERCDLWSAAVVIYVVLGGYAPFEGSTNELPGMICSGEFAFHEKYWKDVSEAPKVLIRSLLRVDPEDRATLEQCLDGEWLKRKDKQFAEESMSNMSATSFDQWLQRQSVATPGKSFLLFDDSSRSSLSLQEL